MRTLLMALLLLPLHALARGDAVDRYAADFIRAERIPGLSVAVVRDGKLVKAAGYGVANLEWQTPASADTQYEIGSITKTFTAQALLMLVEEGKLALDDPLSKHLADLPAAWQPLTLRQLLTHTSGLKDWEGPGLLSFHREWSDAEYIALLAPYPLDFAPGARWSYSNAAYPLLGMVIAHAAGEPYDAFVARRIFEPLGMGATRFVRPLEIVPQRAGGYVEEGGKLRKGELMRPRIVEPNGAIVASVRELAKWARGFDAGVLLSADSLGEMQTPVRLADGTTFPAGLGVFVSAANGHRSWVHNGSTPGGFSSVFYHYPDDRLTVFVLCNIDRGDAVNRIATHVAGMYIPALAAKPNRSE